MSGYPLPPGPPVAPLTVRERIMAWLTAAFRSMQAGQPVNDPYSITWSRVENEAFDVSAREKYYALMLLDTVEKTTTEISVVYCDLRLIIDWRAYVASGSDRNAEAHRIQGDIQRFIKQDITLGGNAIGIDELGGEIKTDAPNVHEISGLLYFCIRYRRRVNDPRYFA